MFFHDPSEKVLCIGSMYRLWALCQKLSVGEYPYGRRTATMGQPLCDVSGLLPPLSETCGMLWQADAEEGTVFEFFIKITVNLR